MDIKVKAKFNIDFIIDDVYPKDWKNATEIERNQFILEYINDNITDIIEDDKIIFTYDDEKNKE